MKKFFKDCFTEDDGISYCFAKVTSFFAIMCYLANTTYSIYAGHAPNLEQFGTGLMQVFFGCAALITGKQATQKPDTKVYDLAKDG